jgi:UDP-N-acetylglucosamine transferase subunit ALG13
MHPTGFERLVREMDKVAGKIDEEVIMQIGGTKYIPLNAKHFGFGTEDEVKLLCQKARIVVTHGGVGTILNVLQEGATVVVVPRLERYDEAIDDHQLVFVQELEKQGKITAVYDVERLEEVLFKLDVSRAVVVRDDRLVKALKKYIAQFARGQ